VEELKKTKEVSQVVLYGRAGHSPSRGRMKCGYRARGCGIVVTDDMCFWWISTYSVTMWLRAKHTFIENDALPVVGEQRVTIVGLLPLFSLDSLIGGEDNIGWLYCLVVPESALAVVGPARQPTVVNMTGHISMTP
jgi:hypothetical protein